MKNYETIENLFGKKEGEIFYLENNNREVNLGRLAIRLEHLGMNDPLSHLFQYLEKGEKSIAGIKEDLETDIVERLPDTPFISRVMFDFAEDDFVSSIGKVSMRTMTRNNLNILAEASFSAGGGNLTKEYERALIEAEEPEKLKQWLLGAKTGSFLIFESLPIGEQKIAVSRIYRKVDSTTVEGSFVSFYQPSVKNFNELRCQIGAGNERCETEIELLSSSYEFFSSAFKDSDNFIEYYRYSYDQILSRNNGGDETYFFGLSCNDSQMRPRNGLNIVQEQASLTEVYFEALRILANCGGKVNEEVINLAKNLNLNLQLGHSETVSMDIAREYLNQVIRGIARVIHQADEEILIDMSSSDMDKLSGHAAISYYSTAQQGAMTHDYANNVCPTYSRDDYNNNGEAVASEYNILTKSFNIYQNIDNFGTPRVGVCIISGCPSRGSVEWLPSRTIVGGCSICVSCHKIFNAGKSPEKIYLKEKSKQVKKSLSRSL